ncbi:MAG: RNA 2'-phosphotransferase, partial [Planctomycetaceae bacterium]
MDVVDTTTLSKILSHALRHEPWLYELELDEEGWARIEDVVQVLRPLHESWSRLDETALTNLVRSFPKVRHEIDKHRIRALYGHSLPGRLSRVRTQPPQRLFHGTTSVALPRIQSDGLAPMKRQYVHLSVDELTAIEVGKRKTENPVILIIKADEAWDNGIAFYEGNAHVWLAD